MKRKCANPECPEVISGNPKKKFCLNNNRCKNRASYLKNMVINKNEIIMEKTKREFDAFLKRIYLTGSLKIEMEELDKYFDMFKVDFNSFLEFSDEDGNFFYKCLKYGLFLNEDMSFTIICFYVFNDQLRFRF